MGGGGKSALELAKVKSQNAHFTCSARFLQRFFPPSCPELSQTPDSAFLSQFFLLILTRLLIVQPPDLAPGPQLPQAMEIADSLLKVIVDMVEQSQNTLSIQTMA